VKLFWYFYLIQKKFLKKEDFWKKIWSQLHLLHKSWTFKIAENPAIAEKNQLLELSAIAGFYCNYFLKPSVWLLFKRGYNSRNLLNWYFCPLKSFASAKTIANLTTKITTILCSHYWTAIIQKNNFLNPNFWGSGYYLRVVVNGVRTVVIMTSLLGCPPLAHY